ncbi:MAG TPA: hypothetical protein VGL21_00595 [Jatrophihabitantaceae bacterium]
MSVLVLRAYVFVCNAAGCSADTGKIDPSSVSSPARSAWAVARREGWTSPTPGSHLCPEHQQHEGRR